MSVHTFVCYDCSSSSISLNQWLRGIFQLEICEDFQAFFQNTLAKDPRKVGVSIRPFRSHIVRSNCIYSTIMEVAKWERGLWRISLFCESVKRERIWPFSNWKTPQGPSCFTCSPLVPRPDIVNVYWHTLFPLPAYRWLCQLRKCIHVCFLVWSIHKFAFNHSGFDILIMFFYVSNAHIWLDRFFSVGTTVNSNKVLGFGIMNYPNWISVSV